MTTVFETKVRRLGNSLAVIVPNQIAVETGAREGDDVKVSIMSTRSSGSSALDEFAGKNIGAKPFSRNRRDRI